MAALLDGKAARMNNFLAELIKQSLPDEF